MNLHEHVRYGASELKRVHNRHLFLALMVSVALHIALIGYGLAGARSAGAELDPSGRYDTLVVLPTQPGMIEQPTEVTEVRRLQEVPRQSRVTGCYFGTVPPPVYVPEFAYPPVDRNKEPEIARAGNPVPSSAPRFEPNFGLLTDVEIRSSRTGDTAHGNGTGAQPRTVSTQGEAPEPMYLRQTHIESFDSDVVHPTFDRAALAWHTGYPVIARAIGIQGRVIIRALIDTNGRAIWTSFEQRTMTSLDDAALRAVQSTIFRPATLHGDRVPAYLFIPMNFILD